MAKTIARINEKIKKGQAVVVTADEMVDIVKTKGNKKAAEEIDVVTTGTFGPMCSSGAFVNLGNTSPKMKMDKVFLNNVEVYAGLAAVDIFIGATSLRTDDPKNRYHPGKFSYGGGHLIEDLISGKTVSVKAEGYGTDCYPRKELETEVSLDDVNDAVMYNCRNAYQNYNCAVNKSKKTIYTYMGILKPHLGNANYCSAGQLSPLLNDPEYRTIGIGTKIFLGGAQGYVTWNGTQHLPNVKRNKKGIPESPSGTLMVIGDLKKMSSDWVKGVSMVGYGASLMVGIGIPIPILNENIALTCGVSDDEISCPVVDYSYDYPSATGKISGNVSYGQLKSGKINIKGHEVPTASLSSYSKAVEIAQILKKWINKGKFTLSEPQGSLPDSSANIKLKNLEGEK
ncbi:MAG: homocysteine biosynthesis protein [Elusimicrobiota bacterium]